jgi:carbonic anhydrase/acetyltransferase-like protein (isoleucine patch superfamily)
MSAGGTMSSSRHGGGAIIPFGDRLPVVPDDVFLAPGVHVIGDVEIGSRANIWFGCTLRGDVNIIRVGAGTNVQDGTVVHVTRKTHGTFIGANCTIGHGAVIHGCTLEDGCYIGMRATVMDVVESGAMVAAGALVTPGKRVPSGELWSGSPARLMRRLTPEQLDYIRDAATHYAALGAQYRERLAAM